MCRLSYFLSLYVMDYDHVHGEKCFDLSIAVQHRVSIQRLEEEMENAMWFVLIVIENAVILDTKEIFDALSSNGKDVWL